MKRKAIWLVLALWAAVALAQGTWNVHIVKWHTANLTTTQQDTINGLTTAGARVLGNGTLADTVTYITGTEMDTTRVERLAPHQTFGFTLTDTSASDSVGIKFRIYTGSLHDQDTAGIPPYSRFVLVDSVTVSTSSYTNWVYTSPGSNRPNDQFYYLTAEGTSANKKASAVKVKAESKQWWR